MIEENELNLTEQEQGLLDDYKKVQKLPNKKHSVILLKQDGSLVVALAEDGELTLGQDIAVDEAGQAFWNYIQTCAKAQAKDSLRLTALKSECYDLIQENKALKQKLATHLCNKVP